ncbi:MAG: porin [Acidobacteria bacterium]|nr:porin [Acidobacteriota bacterium]
MNVRTSLTGALCACILFLFAFTPYARGEEAASPPPPLSPAELAARLETLKAEMARLEHSLTMMDEGIPASRAEASVAEMPASAPASPPAPAPPEPAQDADSSTKLPPVLNFLSSTNITGMVDGYHQYNVNQPADRIAGLRAFTGPSNEISLNMAKLALSKAPTTDSRVGFGLSMAFGEAINVVNGSELGFAQYLEEAYLSYMVNEKFQVDFGKWVTPIGAEVIESNGNWNYSRGLLFTWAIPFYHYGLRANYAINDKTWVTAHLANGWNNVVENNSGKTFALQVGFSPTEKISVVQNYIVGPEMFNAGALRHLLDTIVTYEFNDQLSFMVNYDYGMEEGFLPADPNSKWQGVAGYLRYALSDKAAVASRLEWFQDDDAWSTGVSQQVKEFTQTFEYELADGLMTRFEIRRDWSTEPFFLKNTGSFVQNQTTFILGLTYSFDASE